MPFKSWYKYNLSQREAPLVFPPLPFTTSFLLALHAVLSAVLLCVHVWGSSFFLLICMLMLIFCIHNYVNRICPGGRRVSGDGEAVVVVGNQIKSCFWIYCLFSKSGLTARTYWWCCIWHRRTSLDRVVTPSGRRCSWASRCQCHRWRCHSRVPSLKREDRRVRHGRTFLTRLTSTYSHGEILTMLPKMLATKPHRRWISCLCTRALMNTRCLLWRVANSLFPALFSSFDVSLYNLSSDQTYSPPPWALPQRPRFVVTALGFSFHTCKEERRVRLTAPLTCGIAQGLVPGGGQGLHCNREA